MYNIACLLPTQKQIIVPPSMEAKAVELSITTMDAPSSLPWKLYQNPHFSSESLHDSTHHILPFDGIETRPHPMDNSALPRTEIDDLRSDLEVERRIRRDTESLTRSLSLELAEERRLRAEAEAEAARCRDAADRAVQDAEEERRMLKYADAWREERMQMKLADAAIVLEEKMRDIAKFGVSRSNEIDCKGRQGRENLHIKKGVKGFVESPKTAGKVRSPGLGREKERVDRKLECQTSQLRVLLRQKNTGNLRVVADSQSLVVQWHPTFIDAVLAASAAAAAAHYSLEKLGTC